MRLFIICSAILLLEGFAKCDNNDTDMCDGDSNDVTHACDDNSNDAVQKQYMAKCDDGTDACDDNDKSKDAVLQQYMEFPYPPFGEDKVEEERLHYATGNTIKVLHRSLLLQDLNHFLFKGKQGFR